MEKISLAAGIVIISFVTIAFTQTPQQQEFKIAQAVDAAPKTSVVNDTIPDKETKTSRFTYVTTIDGKEYRIHEVSGKVTKLYVDGKRIPDDKFADNKEIIERIHIEAKEQQDKLDAENMQLAKEREELLAQQERMQNDNNKMNFDSLKNLNKEKAELYIQQQELLNGQNKMNAGSMEKLNKEQEELYAKMAELKAQQELINMKEMEKANLDYQQQLKQHNAELMVLVEELKKQHEVMKQEAKTLSEKDAKKQAELLNKQMIDLKNEQMKIEQQRKRINVMVLNQDRNSMSVPATPSVEAFKGTLQAKPATPNAPVFSIPPIPPFEETKPLKQIINDLIDEKIISSKNNLSIILNNELLKINGIIQSEELHARLKEKYLKGTKDHVIYSKHGGSIHADINVDSGSTHLDGNEK